MKRPEILLLCCFSTIILFSCKKQSAKEEYEPELKPQVVSWLMSNKSPNQPNKAANIQLLSESLLFSKMIREESHDGETLLIIPISENYQRKKNFASTYVPTLVIKMNAAGQIRNGNIVLFKPKIAVTLLFPQTPFPPSLLTHNHQSMVSSAFLLQLEQGFLR